LNVSNNLLHVNDFLLFEFVNIYFLFNSGMSFILTENNILTKQFKNTAFNIHQTFSIILTLPNFYTCKRVLNHSQTFILTFQFGKSKKKYEVCLGRIKKNILMPSFCFGRLFLTIRLDPYIIGKFWKDLKLLAF